LLQLAPPAQIFPQVPQLLLSVEVFTQEPPQKVWPMEQTDWQVPLVQLEPAPQTLPQVPQLLLSVLGFTQTPPQRLWPAGQAD